MKRTELKKIIKEEINGILNEDKISDLKEKLKTTSDLYKRIKDNAYRMYYDPIDFPQDTKNRLQQLSAEKATLQRQIDPKKAADKDEKNFQAQLKKRRSNDELLKKIKKEVLLKFPDIKIGEQIVWNWSMAGKYGPDPKYRTKAESLLKSSSWSNISRVKEYVIDARSMVAQLKQEYKATGHIDWMR